MNTGWKEFKGAPGVYYRLGDSGRLEIIGPPESLGSWRDLAEELHRANFLEEWKKARKAELTLHEDQLELFSELVQSRISKRLSNIPVLKRPGGRAQVKQSA